MLSSADWMPRNLFRRIEIAFPVEDGNLRERIIKEILATSLADNTRARFLHSDGSYRKPNPGRGERRRRSQSEFVALAAIEEPGRSLSPNGRTKYPLVKLAPSPFSGKRK
jgi:polyphosphate kinase